MLTHLLGVHFKFIIVHNLIFPFKISDEWALYNYRGLNFSMFRWFSSDVSPDPAMSSSKLEIGASSHLLLLFAMWFHFRQAYTELPNSA